MEETRRFLRYVIPGLLFFMEVSIYLLFSAKYEFILFLKDLGKGISLPILIFLASGALGFLFSLIYYPTINTCLFPKASYKPLLEECISKKLIKLKDPDDNTVEVDKITISSAWRIFAAYWNERKNMSEYIKAANSRIDSLSDILHGLGSSLVGSIIAIIIWLFVHIILTKVCIQFEQIWISLLISIFIIWIHLINYFRVKKEVHSIVAIIIRDELKNEHEKPLQINISNIDIKKIRKFFNK